MPQPQLSLNAQREMVINASLAHVVFDGWSDVTLKRAIQDTGLEPHLLAILFPQGGIDAIAFYSRSADQRIVDLLSSDDSFLSLPIPVKIRTGILKRFELIYEHKEAVRKGLTMLSWPTNAALGITLLAESCDHLWKLAGDSATDINWYTKRTILAGIYSATVLFWLNDDSKDMAETEAFLDRRLTNVKDFGQWKAKIMNNLSTRKPRPVHH